MQAQTELQAWTPEFDQFPILTTFFQQVAKRGLKIDTFPRQNGLEVHFLNQVNGMPNRARLRIFFATATKCVLFFYKKSSIPFSRDRFSYGSIVIDARSTARFEESSVEQWIQFLLSGFQPKLRPNSLKKGLPYTVPED